MAHARASRDYWRQAAAGSRRRGRGAEALPSSSWSGPLARGGLCGGCRAPGCGGADVLAHEQALDPWRRLTRLGGDGHHVAHICVEVEDSVLASDDVLSTRDRDIPQQRDDAGIGIVDPVIAATHIRRIPSNDVS